MITIREAEHLIRSSAGRWCSATMLKADGTIRYMAFRWCTPEEEKARIKNPHRERQDCLTVYDDHAKDWRTISLKPGRLLQLCIDGKTEEVR